LRNRSRRRGVGALVALVALSSCAPGAGTPPQTGPPPESATWWPAQPPADRWFPVAALVLANGKLAVAETNQNRIFLLDAPDAVPFRAPAPGRSPVEWTALSPAPGLSFYALDGPGRLIQQYDLQGNYLGVALDLDTVARDHDLGPVGPAGLAVDRTGHAVVSDRLGDRLLVFGPGWSYLGIWGQSGSEAGSWRRPGQVAVGDRPPFLVADEGNRRVVLVDGLGEVLAMRETADVPRGVAVLGSGRYAVSEGSRVRFLGPGLIPDGSVELPAAEGCAGRTYAAPALTGDDGEVFVGDGCSGRVAELRRPGG
jgi:hypothetical protein